MSNLTDPHDISQQFDPQETSISDHHHRVQLIIKVRWLLLLLITTYCLISYLFIYFSPAKQQLSPVHLMSIIAIFCIVSLYNQLLQKLSSSTPRGTMFDCLQIILDLLITTTFIHISGGGSSWFWPIYLIIAFESVLLLKISRCIILIGIFSNLLFGLALAAGYHNILNIFDLNFICSQHKHDANYLILLWLWVCFLNVAAAIIGRFFYQTILRDAQEVTTRENQLQRFMDNAQDLIFAFDEKNTVHYMNKAVMERLGIDTINDDGDGALLTIEQILHDDDMDHWKHKTCLLGINDFFKPEIFHLRTQTDDAVHVECRINSDSTEGKPLHWAICRDLSEQIERDHHLHNIANHDHLTGLANRQSFTEQVQQSTRLAKRYHQQLAMVLLSVDHLKIINTTMSIQDGDTLLCEFTQRLLHSVRETDIVGRLAGNQFVILLINVDDRVAVELVIEKLRKRLAAPLTFNDHEFFITASIGLSLYPQNATNIEEMIKQSSDAMYNVKNHGGNNVAFYSPEMASDIKNHLEMINGLHNALANNELQLHYQPKVNIASGKFNSVEALLRWNHPTLGQVAPSDFIPMAEESGVIGDLTKWILHQVCLQSKQWQEQGLEPIKIAVNVSGHQLQSRELLSQIENVLEQTKLNPQLLEIEVTESVLMQNPEAASSLLKELRDLGVQLSIDDFGTGYSSLAYLKRFPVHSLKIDRSFILDVEQSAKYASITATIIAMGKTLNLNIIAEGVETLGQMAFLKEHHCDEVQGYLYSRPVPANEIATLLNNLKNQTHPFAVDE